MKIKNLTLQEVINIANKIHNNKFNYSKINLNKPLREKQIIICPKHGDFEQLLHNHLNGTDCKNCADTTITLEEFLERANKLHNGKFNYSKVVITEGVHKAGIGIIICPTHGDFPQRLSSHLEGYGCKKCAGIARKISLAEFIIRANKVHKNRYGYSKITLAGRLSNKEIITCPVHGDFEQILSDHLGGHGCKDCLRLSLDEFIERANKLHDNKFNYSKTIVDNGINEDGIIICPTHGEFTQRLSSHLEGRGCKTCLEVSLDEFIERANKLHRNKYGYSKVTMSGGVKAEEIIICPIHGEFLKQISLHLRGQGCFKCSPCSRVNETIVKDFFKNNNLHIARKFKIKLPINEINNSYSYPDIFVPFLNLIVEYNGLHHYIPTVYYKMTQKSAEKNFIRQIIRDEQLREYCKNNSINLLEIDGRIYQGKILKKFLFDYFISVIMMNNFYKEIEEENK